MQFFIPVRAGGSQ